MPGTVASGRQPGAIDGTFLKANASPGSIHTKARLEKEVKKLDERIAAYHQQLDEADAEPEDGAEGGEDPDLAAKIEALVEKQNHKKALSAGSMRIGWTGIARR